MNRRILNLALPNIITNITVPLLSTVDLAIVGRLGSTQYIGAIALATMVFNTIYWLFGFLRMGTSGFTAQAYGAKDFHKAMQILIRSLTVGLTIASILMIFQRPIIDVAIHIIDGSEEMKSIVRRYYFINIWAAPALLSLYSFKGWFIGMQNSIFPMIIAIGINVANIVLSLVFVYILHLDIEGIALGTLLSQYLGLTIAMVVFIKRYGQLARQVSVLQSIVWAEMRQFFKVNSDIFLRTVCLVAVFSYFPIAGSHFGDNELAINTLLLQFFTLFSYIMDGFAYAGEALTGRFIGAKDSISLKKSIRANFVWGIILTAIFTLIYAFFGNQILSIFTDKEEIITLSAEYYWWVLLVPVSGFSAFLWDGIFIGATASREMFWAIFLATLIFFATYFGLKPYIDNNALWLSLILFLALRGLGQTLLAKKAVFYKLNHR